MRPLLDLWRYRFALRNLVVHDLKSRYKKSVLGFLWSLLNPLALILAFLIVFKYIWRNNESNYSVKLFTTVLAWRFFSSTGRDGVFSAAPSGASLGRSRRGSHIVMPGQWGDGFYGPCTLERGPRHSERF